MLIDNPDVTVDELMTQIKGPDFPTGALILGREGIKKAYSTGRGSVKMRARATIEEKLSNWDEELSSGALDVHIYNLRQKLGKQFIRTVHGVGYALGQVNEK